MSTVLPFRVGIIYGPVVIRYALVWDETLRVYREMITREGWASKVIVDIPKVQTYTFKVSSA